jgi:MarR family transcriptional regulator, organic hydroperoxide resistance regulator
VDQRKPAGRVGQAGGACPHPDPILRAVFELSALLRDRAQVIGRDLALPPPVAMALAQISGTISMRELGQRLGCERSFITVIADELERRALVQRQPDCTDRRVKNLVLTPEGAALRARLDSEFFAQLPWRRALDEDQRASLLNVMNVLIQAEYDTAAPAQPEAVTQAR